MKKVQRIDYFFEFLRVFLGIVLAFAICLIIIVLLTGSAGAKDAIYNFAIGPFMTKRRLGMLLHRFACYLLTGAGMCFVYSSGRFSVISEGIINLAPIFALLLMFGTNMLNNLPLIINLVIIITICVVAGGLISFIPAFGREKLGANETVTSTILNSFCCYIALFILRETVADKNSLILASPIYPDNMRFPRYFGNTNATAGIWVGVIGIVVAIIIFYRTKIGAEIRMCGSNINFAKYSGINTRRAMYAGQILGGLFAGAAAAVDCFGLYEYYRYGALTNIGMDGLIVAVMARKKPIFVPITAFVLAYIRCAAEVLNANTQIPIEIVTMLQAVIIFFVAAEHFLAGSRQKAIIKASYEAQQEGGAE